MQGCCSSCLSWLYLKSKLRCPLQANAQQLYVINGDGGIGVAYTYRNFTATSQYYGVALVGKYQESELYQVCATASVLLRNTSLRLLNTTVFDLRCRTRPPH